MVMFSHLEEGTSEDVWRAEERIRSTPLLDAAIDELVVVAAHPDDETLGAAGLIRRVHSHAGRITVVVATDGEASHPNSMSHTRTDLSAIRRVEVSRAVHALAPGADVRFLGLPDGALRENVPSLEEGLRAVLDAVSECALVVAPWSGDGHRDHRVTAEAVARLAAHRRLRHLGYPIWLWHWGLPADVPWDSGVALVLSPGERSIKARALRTHASQTQPLSAAPGDEAIVTASMQAHFERDTELFFVEAHGCDGAQAQAGAQAHAGAHSRTLPAAFFDDFYARHDDPWGFETRWYEERKRALLMASLPSKALGRVLEIGCATGSITVELAARADEVLAIDVSQAALEAARRRLAGDPRVTFRRGWVPDDQPSGVFETIVLSEVGYYLSPGDLELTIAGIDAALADDGCLVACHWRHPVAEYPLGGDDVHRALRAVRGWEVLSRHEEEDFVLEVFCRRPAVSVARREGLR
jgi:LmbE family N-acetylglucosaminyl deacetylase/SAM-dependent methyltransferase